MVDHSLTDLSYGLLGKPTYHSQSGTWDFSVNEDLVQKVVQLRPLEECLAGSFQPIDEKGQTSSREVRNHLKELVKSHPEFHSASDITFEIAKMSFADKAKDIEGSLLSVGRAVDNGRFTGSLTPLILAMSYGDAGHILRIIRPCVEKRGWGDGSGASLSLFTARPSDQADFEIGTGGPIRQITFSNEETASGTWLAVRQDTTTIICRVVFSAKDEKTSFPGQICNLHYSNIQPQSVVALDATRSASSTHVDVTFNPLYPRQIAVVDADGRWSIWDIEGRHGQNSSFKLMSGKSGGIYDAYVADPKHKLPNSGHTHGWHRILWVCNVTTIMICNRHHIALFDLQSNPIRLGSRSFLVGMGYDMILDIKRSPVNINYVYVLTTSKLYWLEITPSSNLKQGTSGTKVVLSYRHFRNERDTTLKLATLMDKYVTVLIYSTEDKILNFYSFPSESQNRSQHQSAQGSLVLSSSNEDGYGEAWKSVLFLQIPLHFRQNKVSEIEAEHFRNVRFLQPWIVTVGQGLLSALCAISDIDDRILSAPSIILSRSKRRLGSRYVTESFIVPDSGSEPHIPVQSTRAAFFKEKDFNLDWRRLFQKIFLEEQSSSPQKPETASNSGTLLSRLSDRIGRGIEENDLTIGTLLELSDLTVLSENLEDVAANLRNFLHSLPEALDDQYELVVSDLTTCDGLELPISEGPRSFELMNFYEQLVGQWMASLPVDVPNATRAAKFKIVRQVAVELCFSSIAISLKNKLISTEALEGQAQESHGANHNWHSATRESSPATFYSSQSYLDLDRGPESSLPTPTRTPSVYSQSTTGSEYTEDPAITHLRQYTSSIKSRPDFQQSKLLSEWPAAPGVDPATYHYRPPGADHSDEESRKTKRDQARRRRRTEKFLRNNAESSSQHIVTSLGSQPSEVLQPDFSSQPREGMPMTQPDRGTFGSRLTKGKQKRQKKQRAAGF